MAGVAMSEAAQPATALGLRTCAADMTSHGGFRWPEAGEVIAPDWSPEPVYGGGLHLLPWGRGAYGLLSSAADARWLVVEYDPTTAVDLGDKVKVPRATVVYCGTSAGAIKVLRDQGWGREQGAPVKGIASTTGRAAHASTTGEGAHASTTGCAAHASTTGRAAHASTTGYAAHASTRGEDAIAASFGSRGRVKATHGPLVASYRDTEDRLRVAVAYPGEDGIKPDTWYRVDERGRFVRDEDMSPQE